MVHRGNQLNLYLHFYGGVSPESNITEVKYDALNSLSSLYVFSALRGVLPLIKGCRRFLCIRSRFNFEFNLVGYGGALLLGFCLRLPPGLSRLFKKFIKYALDALIFICEKFRKIVISLINMHCAFNVRARGR